MLAVMGEGFGLKYCLGALSLTTGVTYIETQLINNSIERVEGTTLAVVGEGFGLKYYLGP